MIAAASERLAAAGCDTPRLDAELLLAHVLGTDRAGLVTRGDGPLSGEQRAAFDSLVARRAAREPVAYLVGTKGFRYIDLHVDPRVLIPRPDTETLVDVAVERAPAGARVHDVGTGSGAVALALKDERADLAVTASDVSADAVDVARGQRGRPRRRRPRRAGRRTAAGRLRPGRRQPALRPRGRMGRAGAGDPRPRAAPGTGQRRRRARRDPRLGGGAPAGLALALEHGPDQGAAVRALLRDARTVPDLAGRDRVTIGAAP